MTSPLVATSLLGSLAGPSILIATTDIGASVAIAGVKLASSSYTTRSQPTRRNLHTTSRRHVSLHHHTSPLLSQGGISRTRTSSSVLPLDQRANFWHRACRSSKSPYGQASHFKTAEDAMRLRGVQQQWQKNIEKMNSLHEMMRRRHMDFMKRRLETEPYEELFGWRNRMRAGLPQQMWVKGSDVLKAKNAEGNQSHSTQQMPSASQIVQEPKVSQNIVQQPKSDDQVSEAQTYNSQLSSFHNPTVESSVSTFEYDPIANRMVHKRVDAFSSYEAQEPMKEAQQDNIKSLESQASHDEASLRAEFEEYKARRLPENFAEATDSASNGPKLTQERPHARSLSRVADRAKLEDSFQQVHKDQSEKHMHDSIRPLMASRNARPVPQKSDLEYSASQVDIRSYEKYDSALDKLAARIKNVGERVEQLQSQRPTAEPVVRSSSQLEAEELLRKQFRDFRKLTAKPSSAQASPQAEQSQKTISFKQLAKDDAATSPSSAASSSAPQQHVYEILAYDPVTSEVNSTTISAPVAPKEQVIGLSEALARLAEPAKFLPHLRLLKDQGFEPVTATNNMLVLRGIPTIKAAAQSIPQAAAESTAGEGGNIPPSGTQGESGHFDYDGWSRHRSRRWRRRRFVRRVLFWGAATGAVVYIAGRRSNHHHDRHSERRARSRDKTYPDTEEEMYRAMREGSSSPRRDSYAGMRKVTYPKDKDV